MHSELHDRSISRRLRGLILPLLRPQLQLCAQFWAPWYKRQGQTGELPVKGQEGEEGTGASLLSGKAERAGVCSAWRSEGSREPSQNTELLEGRVPSGQTPLSATGLLLPGPQSQTQTKEIPSQHQETLFHCEGH